MLISIGGGPERARRISRYAGLILRVLSGRTGLEDPSGLRRRTVAELLDVSCGVEPKPWANEYKTRAALPLGSDPPLSVELQERINDETMAMMWHKRGYHRRRKCQENRGGVGNFILTRPDLGQTMPLSSVRGGTSYGQGAALPQGPIARIKPRLFTGKRQGRHMHVNA